MWVSAHENFMFGLQEALLESSEQSHLLQFCSMVVRALNCWELICVLPLSLKPLHSFLGGVHTAFSRRQFYLLNYEQCIFSNIYVCSSIFSCKYDKTQLVSSFSLSVFFCMTLFFLKIRLHFSSVCTVFPPLPPQFAVPTKYSLWRKLLQFNTELASSFK